MNICKPDSIIINTEEYIQKNFGRYVTGNGTKIFIVPFSVIAKYLEQGKFSLGENAF